MARIDITKIEGYAAMTAEQKIAALEGFDLETPDLSKYVTKDLYDKAASEAATWKKKVRENQTDDERKKQEDKEKDERLKELERRVAISDTTESFINSGYDAENAKKAATALFDRDDKAFFEIQKSVMDSAKAAAVAEKMKSTPEPQMGEVGTGKRDYNKEIAAAQERGDTVLAANLMSQQFAENQNNNNGGNT